jgi:transcriptional regulator with XRE-family HTH domain
MTQRDLAVALGREHGMVARIELGERRVDFAEAYQIFVALGTDPNQEADSLMTKFAASVVDFSQIHARSVQRLR